MMKDVLITIRGSQLVAEDDDAIEMKTVGRFGLRDGMVFLYYTEVESYGKEVKTVIRVKDGEVVFERSGAVESRMVVQKGVRTSCLHRTEHGSFLLGIYGVSIRNELNENGGKLTIAYHIDINSGLVSKNRLEITVKEGSTCLYS